MHCKPSPSDRTICTCGSNTCIANELRSPEARALHVLSTLRSAVESPTSAATGLNGASLTLERAQEKHPAVRVVERQAGRE
jgi:hypothetical protein